MAVFITANMNITYWLLRCGGNTCTQKNALSSEHGDSKFFQNIAVCLPKYVAVFFEYSYLGC